MYDEVTSIRAKCAALHDENQRVKAVLKGIARDNLRSLINALYLSGGTSDVVIYIAKNLTQSQVRLDQDSKPPRGWTKVTVSVGDIKSEEDIEKVLADIYDIPVKFHRVIKEF